MHCMRRHNIAPFKFQDGREFDPCKVLHDTKNRFFIGYAARNISVAFIARDNDQTKGFDFSPEGFVIHRLKPGYNIVSIFEFHRETILTDRILRTQISRNSGGSLS